MDSPYVIAALIVGSIFGVCGLLVLWTRFCARISRYSTWGLALSLSPIAVFAYVYLVWGLS